MTESFKVWISNGSILEWLVIAIAMVPTIPNPNNWKSKQNGGHFVQMEQHWKTKQRTTIGIPNVLSIPAPTAIVKLGESRPDNFLSLT